MKDMSCIEQLKINSNIHDNLNENTSDDVAVTIDLIGSLINSKYNDSLSYQIADVIPLTGSFGKIYASTRKKDTNDMEIISKDVNTQIKTIKTGFTQEVIQDMQSMFNKSAKTYVQGVVKGLSAQEENRTLINLLESQSEVKPKLIVIDSHIFEQVLFQISQKVSESVIEMNRTTYKTLDSFCILPKDFAASVLGSFTFMSEGKEKNLYVGRVGRTDYYINPFPNTTSQFTDDFDIDYEIEDTSIPNYAYVGLKSGVIGQSSLVFSPYIYESQYITDPDTGEIILIVRNRYGISTNPLHRPLQNESLLHKFELIKG